MIISEKEALQYDLSSMRASVRKLEERVALSQQVIAVSQKELEEAREIVAILEAHHGLSK